MAEAEGKKRVRPKGSGYLSRGSAKHALFESAGWNSPARCGTSPHWGDYIGWRGHENDEEKERLESLPWCGRCKTIVAKDLMTPVQLAKPTELVIKDNRLAGGGVLH